MLVGLRAIFGERLMVDATGRQYYVAGKGAGGGISSDIGGEIISRLYLGFTVRVYGPHGIGVQYLISTRDTSVPGQGDRHQRGETVNLTYNFLGHTRFGAVEWRREKSPAADPPAPSPGALLRDVCGSALGRRRRCRRRWLHPYAAHQRKDQRNRREHHRQESEVVLECSPFRLLTVGT